VTSAATVVLVEPDDFEWDSPTGAAEAVRRATAEATAADGNSPLDEAALLSLRHSGLATSALWLAELSETTNAMARVVSDNSVAGFALADAPPGSSGDVEVNLVVTPAARRRGVGGALADTVLRAYPTANISAWSHGNHPAASVLADALGFERVRDLWVMRRRLDGSLPEVDLPGSYVVRTFEPGRDEEAFLELNAAAFADHPEQGDLTRADLDRRMAEDWFDPAGFFVAQSLAQSVDQPGHQSSERGGRLLGFHWTKVHPSYGEVYVVGVSPAAQGTGLGKVLTLTGLHHLRSLGLGEVVLYVESDNDPAVAVYRGLGFTHADTDTHVMFRRAGARANTVQLAPRTR